jgi:tellurite resistance protein
MNIRKVIERRIRRQDKGVNAAADMHAVVAANVGKGSSHSHVSSRSRQRIVQRSGRTHVTEEHETVRGGDDESAGGDRDRG